MRDWNYGTTKVKAIDALGISPYQWKINRENGLLSSANGTCSIVGEDGRILNHNDERLILSSPQLYSAARNTLRHLEHIRRAEWWFDIPILARVNIEASIEKVKDALEMAGGMDENVEE